MHKSSSRLHEQTQQDQWILYLTKIEYFARRQGDLQHAEALIKIIFTVATHPQKQKGIINEKIGIMTASYQNICTCPIISVNSIVFKYLNIYCINLL